MTLGLWLEKEHIDDVDPVVRYFNFDRPYFKQTERCETLSLKIHLTRFTEEQLERPCSVPTYRSKPFGLYLFPDERKWHPGKEMWCSNDSMQLFFDDLSEMLDFACDIRKALNDVGIKTSWDIDFFTHYAKEVRQMDEWEKQRLAEGEKDENPSDNI